MNAHAPSDALHEALLHMASQLNEVFKERAEQASEGFVVNVSVSHIPEHQAYVLRSNAMPFYLLVRRVHHLHPLGFLRVEVVSVMGADRGDVNTLTFPLRKVRWCDKATWVDLLTMFGSRNIFSASHALIRFSQL